MLEHFRKQLKHRERAAFEFGVHIGMLIGFGTCGSILAIYWWTK